MQIELFKLLWQTAFEPKIAQLKEACPRLTVGKKLVVWHEYERINKVVHAYMTNPDGRIDRHKVGAAMTRAILHVQPLVLILPSDEDEKNIKTIGHFANEILAFHVALSIVKSFILTKAKEENDATTIKIFSKGFVFPPSTHERYDMHVCKSLHYAKMEGQSDLFIFSNLLFMIESYTRIHESNKLLSLAS
ncbi:MAG: hypothetical protein R8K20_07105 [Gallionellaceae bacterium]